MAIAAGSRADLLAVRIERVQYRAFFLGEPGRRGSPGSEGRAYLGRYRRRQVDVDAEQSRRRLARHRAGDRGVPVAALGDVARVSDPLPAIAGIVAVARTSDAMAAQVVRPRRNATPGVSSIRFLAFMFVIRFEIFAVANFSRPSGQGLFRLFQNFFHTANSENCVRIGQQNLNI
jgi:hypothetical protein